MDYSKLNVGTKLNAFGCDFYASVIYIDDKGCLLEYHNGGRGWNCKSSIENNYKIYIKKVELRFCLFYYKGQYHTVTNECLAKMSETKKLYISYGWTIVKEWSDLIEVSNV